jgi:uncharacterized membrane protein YqhA
MRKVIVSLIISAHVLLTLAIWSATHGVAYSMRYVPLEQQASLLDTTTIREQWELITLGLVGGAFILLLVSFGAYVRERRKRSERFP